MKVNRIFLLLVWVLLVGSSCLIYLELLSSSPPHTVPLPFSRFQGDLPRVSISAGNPDDSRFFIKGFGTPQKWGPSPVGRSILPGGAVICFFHQKPIRPEPGEFSILIRLIHNNITNETMLVSLNGSPLELLGLDAVTTDSGVIGEYSVPVANDLLLHGENRLQLIPNNPGFSPLLVNVEFQMSSYPPALFLRSEEKLKFLLWPDSGDRLRIDFSAETPLQLLLSVKNSFLHFQKSLEITRSSSFSLPPVSLEPQVVTLTPSATWSPLDQVSIDSIAIETTHAPRKLSLPPQTSPNVLIILMDAMRRDIFYEAMSEVSFLSRDCLEFLNAYAPTSWTYPSVVSLLTGLNPFDHSVILPDNVLPSGTTTLFDSFKKKNYRTFVVSSNALIREGSGLESDVDEFIEQFKPKDTSLILPEGENILSLALEQITISSDSPWLAYIHLVDPHDPYSPPPAYRKRVREKYPNNSRLDYMLDERRQNTFISQLINGETLPQPGDRDMLLDLYRAETRYTLDAIGTFLKHLQAIGEWDNTVLLLLSDHGEEFLEHNGWRHSYTLYEEVLRIPLFIRLPGLGTNVQIRENFPLENIRNLLETLLIKNVPEVTINRNRPLYFSAHGEGYVSVLYKNWKYIRERHGVEKLFSLERDPGEKINLIKQSPFHAAYLRNEAKRYRRTLDRSLLNQSVRPIPEVNEKQLKTLGYLN